MRNIDLFIIVVLVAFFLGWAWRAGTGIVRARARELVRDLLPLGIGIAGAMVLQLAIHRYIFGHFQLSRCKGDTLMPRQSACSRLRWFSPTPSGH